MLRTLEMAAEAFHAEVEKLTAAQHRAGEAGSEKRMADQSLHWQRQKAKEAREDLEKEIAAALKSKELP